MSNDLTVPNGNDSYDKLIAQLNERDRATGYDAQPLFVALDGTSFVVKMRGSEEPLAKYDRLQVHLIYAKKTRALYSPDKDIKGPLCRSMDGNVHGMPRIETFAHLERLQNIVAGQINANWAEFSSPQACKSCLFDQWGTRIISPDKSLDDVSVGPGRGCGERKMLVMLHPDFSQPLTMSLSWSSVKNFDKYASGFTSKRPAHNYIEVLTEMWAKRETSPKDSTVKYEVVNFNQSGGFLPISDVMAAAKLALPFMGDEAAADLFDLETATAPAANGASEEIPNF